MQITQISMTTRMLLRHTKAWLSLMELCSCRGMASAAKPSAISKGMLDEIWNIYWAKVLAAEEEALQNVRPWQQLPFVPIHATKEEDIRKPKKGQFLHKNYTFGKPNEADVTDVLNKLQTSHPITKLPYPFEPSTEPPPTKAAQLDLAQWRQAFTKARIYLLGTAHFDRESQDDAKRLIGAVQPDILMLELCQERAASYLLLTDAELEKIANQPFEEYRKEADAERQKLGYPPAADLPKEELLNLEKWDRQEWQKQYRNFERLLRAGTEFRAAFMEAKQVPGCAGAVLGDSLEGIENVAEKFTEQIPNYRVLKRLKAMQLKNEYYNFHFDVWNGHYTHEAALAKQEEFLERYNQTWHSGFGEHLVHARNRNMIRVLHTIAQRCTIEKFCASQRAGVPFEPLTVVALVGFAHLFGITHEWAKPEVVYANTRMK